MLNNMKKCIILSRVSTDIQDIKEQEDNLMRFAKSDGYTDDNIIIISDKESAILLSEEERNGLNQLKEYINNCDIACVYVWELSRIARDPQILYSIRNFLVQNKVQLKVYDPSLILLNSDFTINENSSLIFGLYASMAEAEMRQKKVRFKRGKIRNLKIGKFIGGKIKFGYDLDKDNYFIINEEEANIVRLTFQIYLSGKSVLQTYNELLERGYEVNFSNVQNILHYEGYTGSYIFNGIERKLPQIITQEDYDRGRKQAANNNIIADKAKNIYFCRGLIICKNCGSKYVAVIGNGQYTCNSLFNKSVTEKCKSTSININLLDSIVWAYAKEREMIYLLVNRDNDVKLFEEKIQINEEKITATEDKFKKLSIKKERNSDLYIDGNINKEKYNNNIKSIDIEILDIKKNVEKWESENKDYDKQIEHFSNNYNNKTSKEFIENNLINLSSIDNQHIMYDLIHKHIKKITVEDDVKFKTKTIMIYNYLDKVTIYNVNIRTKELNEYAIFENNIDKILQNENWKNDEILIRKYYEFLKRF